MTDKPPYWRRERCQLLWEEQQGCCFHCGKAMPAPATQRVRKRKHADAATIDHVVPLSLGGKAEWGNEVASCRACNATKADRAPLDEELGRLAALKRPKA